MIETKNKYYREFYIKNYATDHNHILRPASFMDYTQDIATVAANSIDLGNKILAKFGCVWVVARMHTIFLKPLHFEDEVRLYTWHKGSYGPYFVRDYQLCEKDGLPAVNSTSSWVIMDKSTRSLARGEAAQEMLSRKRQDEDDAIVEPCPKVTMPKGGNIQFLGSHQVVWSDVDFNDHVNNAKYTVWAMDVLPKELVYGHFLKEHFINFNKEVKPTETVELYYMEVDNSHIVEGRVGDHQAFIIKFIFE